jgi:rare lipoprotein A (peptidoglycan hydrolase)
LAQLRGKAVTVCYRSSCVVVRVIDCNCQAHRSIDLYSDAFRQLSPLGSGRIKVTISW